MDLCYQKESSYQKVPNFSMRCLSVYRHNTLYSSHPIFFDNINHLYTKQKCQFCADEVDFSQTNAHSCYFNYSHKFFKCASPSCYRLKWSGFAIVVLYKCWPLLKDMSARIMGTPWYKLQIHCRSKNFTKTKPNFFWDGAVSISSKFCQLKVSQLSCKIV